MSPWWRRAGGIAGPVMFVAAWAVLGHQQRGYSPVDDPISRLAATDSPDRWTMTAAFVAFGAGVSLYAPDLRETLSRPPALALAGVAVGTLGIALTPLESAAGGVPHATAAGVSYVSLAAAPILAGRALAARGHRRAATASLVAGVTTGAALLASVLSPAATGLFQRIGLTTGDAWIVAAAWGAYRLGSGDGH